jgi:predicted negative regulator of RcsB-dependent stress response
VAHEKQGELVSAEEHLREALDAAAETLGTLHHITLNAAAGLGRMQLALGSADDAIATLSEPVERVRSELPDGHPWSGPVLSAWSFCLMAVGRHD